MNDENIWFLIMCISGVILIFGLISLSIYESKILEEKNIHYNCLHACSAKHFMGYQLGEDRTAMISEKNEVKLKVYTPTINEFDRTECIKSCNNMLLNIYNK